VVWQHPRKGEPILGSDLALDQLNAAIDELAHAQFQAKANLTHMSLEQIALSDFKRYKLGRSVGLSKHELEVGWGTIETVEPFFSQYAERDIAKLVGTVLPKIRAAHGLSAVFVSVVDIEHVRSFVVCGSAVDCELLRAAFPAGKSRAVARTAGALLDTSPRVSRKHDFIPPLRKALEASAHRP